MATDAELLRLYADTRSEDAFAELVRRHVNLVYGAAVRQLGGDAHAAEDVTQAVFTDLARKARSLAGREVIASWLYTSTRFATAKVRRTLARRLKHETEAEIMHALERGATSTADWEKLRPLVDDAMHALSERDRGAVVLRFFEGRPFGEIGEAYGLSEDAARMRVERALEKLHTLLARRGVTSTSAALGVALGTQAAAAAPAGLAASVTGAALAACGSATATGVLTFMSTAKITVALAVAGGLAGIGFGVSARQHTRSAEESVIALTRERDSTRAALRENETRLAQAEARARALEARDALTNKASAGKAADLASGKNAAGNASARDAARDKLDKAKEKLAQLMTEKVALMANPEVQRARLEIDRLGVGLRYGALYRNLNLTPDQVARFEARWLEARQDAADVFSAATANGVAPNDPAIVALANEAKAKLENDQRAMLGERGFAELQRYDRTFPAREVVSGMLANLATAGAPLTREQMEQLTTVIAEQSSGFQQGERVADRGTDVNWSAVFARSQSFLPPAQADVVRAHAAHAQASQQATQSMSKLVPKAPPVEVAPTRKPSGG